jgi:hypothetical protein
MSEYTGFIAYYKNKAIKEKEYYFNKKLNKKCATNWIDIDKSKLIALELIWKNEQKIKIALEEYPHIKPSDWFFSQYGYFDLKANRTIVVARNIGYIKDNLLIVYSVNEETGIIKVEHRPR